MTYFRPTLLLVGLLLSTLVAGQTKKLSLAQATDSMTVLMKAAYAETQLPKKQALVDQFGKLLEASLKQPYSFTHVFDSIPYLKVLASPDGMLKIYSWAVPDERAGAYKYYGIVQHKRMNKENPLSDVFFLEDVKSELMLPEHEELSYPRWFGCIYYELIEKHDMGNTAYTLIGFDFNNTITHKKYIEVLSFNKQGFPVFGKPLFLEDKEGLKSRIIFEYTTQSVMTVRYMPELDKIVFNFLYPIVPEKKNDKRYFVPDVSYDGFEFKFGKWMKVSNVTLRRKTE